MNLTHPCPLAMYRPPSNDCPKPPHFRTTRSRVCVLYGIGPGAYNTRDIKRGVWGRHRVRSCRWTFYQYRLSAEAASKQARQVGLNLTVLLELWWKHAAAWVELYVVLIGFVGPDQLV